MSTKVKRLFAQFQPDNYQLDLSIDPETMTFSGTVIITGKKVGRPSQRLTFHQKALSITSAQLKRNDKNGTNVVPLTRINTHRSNDEVRLHTESLLYPGLYTVELNFSGKITKSMVGLYPCYFKHNNTEKVMFATQFESHHAREVFPCIDEPEAKATFDLSLVTPKGQEVLANTLPVSQEDHTKSQIKTTFEQTPPMSTYLLAFAFGEIHHVEQTTESGVLFRSWATVAQPKEKLEFSLHEGIKVLDFYESYFGTKFPLKKLDQIALPDFDSAAMENWGLITYREIALLTDPDNRSINSEQYVALVIAHEISHQWFGNLVTMKWWDDLWLNESFASIAEHICLDALHPDWHQWEHYTSADVITSSNRDIYSNVQPVGLKVNHPDEIISLFDPAIVYAKGGRLLKMMREYIGEDSFKNALRHYFETHAYKNTTRDDLWQAMSDASGKDIKALMTPWLIQSGMPRISVNSGASATTRKLSQSRFLADKEPDSNLWPIPLLASEPIQPELFETQETVVNLASDTLPVINQNGSGHFVVNYRVDEDLATIRKNITELTISSESRINILNDLLLLSKIGESSLVDTLQLVQAMKNEPRDAVWSLMSRALGLSFSVIEGEESCEKALRKFRYELAHDHYNSLGWDDVKTDDPNTIGLRATALSLMLSSENSTIIKETLQKYHDSKNIEDIPADRRGHLLGVAVRHDGNPEIIDRLINKYRSTPDPDLQLSICSSLCSTKSPEIVKRLTVEAMGPEGFVRDQDLFRWFAYLMRNYHTRETAWQWLVESWDRIVAEAGGAKSLEYYIWYSASPMQSNSWLRRFNDMFESKKSEIALMRNIEIAQKEIAARIEWADRERPILTSYLKSLQ